jgi:hypothetical protein
VRAVNVRRGRRGEPPLPGADLAPGPSPVPLAQIRESLDRAASDPSAPARAAARAEIEARGPGAVDAILTALESTPATAPGRRDLETLVNRLALTITQVTIAKDSAVPGARLQAALEALRGRRFDEATWGEALDAFLDAPPSGAPGIRLFAERERAGGGVVLRVAFLPAAARAGGAPGWVGLTPRTRRGDTSTGFGQAAVSRAFGRSGCTVFALGIDAALEGIRPAETFSVAGEVRIVE